MKYKNFIEYWSEYFNHFIPIFIAVLSTIFINLYTKNLDVSTSNIFNKFLTLAFVSYALIVVGISMIITFFVYAFLVYGLGSILFFTGRLGLYLSKKVGMLLILIISLLFIMVGFILFLDLNPTKMRIGSSLILIGLGPVIYYFNTKR